MKQQSNTVLFFMFTGTMLTILSCKKEVPFISNASITGIDLRTCVCCGGAVIKINKVPNPNGGDFFLIGNTPANFNLGNNPIFPIEVNIDWKIDTAKCFGNYINITRIERQ